MKSAIYLPIFLLLLHFSYLQGQVNPETTQKIIPERENAPSNYEKPYLILISIDGYRHDYTEIHGAKNLSKLSNEGIRAEALIPSFPTFTFPNHYTIVTGLHPKNHGILANHFYDKSRQEYYSMRFSETIKDGTWYQGIPIWVLAENQKLLTASFYWVGSEADIAGTLPTYHYSYNESIPIDRRIDEVRKWLELPEEKRPHLITFYFPEVDQAGHRFGPESPETRQAVQWVDSAVAELIREVEKTNLPVNYIILSDHGMTKIEPRNKVKLPNDLDQEQFIIAPGAEVVHLFAKDKRSIFPAYELLAQESNDQYQVYLKENLPAHLRTNNQIIKNRIGDIVIIANWPKVISLSDRTPNPGGHGYDPQNVSDMNSIFYAWGPNFKTGIQLPAFESIHVYPIIAQILDLHIPHAIDGKETIANQIVRNISGE